MSISRKLKEIRSYDCILKNKIWAIYRNVKEVKFNLIDFLSQAQLLKPVITTLILKNIK